LLSAGVALVALVLFASLPPWPKIWAVLNDSAHAPVFGLLALTLLTLLRTSSHRSPVPLALAAFAATVLLGIAVEWVQGLIGRDSSWKDVGTDALGAACALGLAGWAPILGLDRFHTAVGRRTALGIALLSGALILLPIVESGLAYARRAMQFPVIARFDSTLDLYFAKAQYADGTLAPLPAPWARAGDRDSLRIVSAAGEWPGFAISEPEPDWRGYRALNVDVTNPDGEPLQLTVRVHDVQHDQRQEDRFNRTFAVDPWARRILSIPVADIASAPAGRPLDLQRVAGVIVFASGSKLPAGRAFYLTRIWLE
jgi:hypothetical protein